MAPRRNGTRSSTKKEAHSQARNRDIKWVFRYHQLLLHTDNGRTGLRLERIMKHRFILRDTGQLDVLMCLWLQDRRRAEVNSRPMNGSARVDMAVKLIERGCVTKALSHIGNEGPGGLPPGDI